MSDRFEDFVSGLAQTAAATAAPGADVARKRAKQRRTRQRLTASALSLVLLGGVGGIAAANLNHTGGSVAPAHSGAPIPAVTVSGSPSPSTSSPAPTTSTSASAPAESGSAPAPGTYHSGDWYDVTDVPLTSSKIAWVPLSNLTGTRIGGDVFEVESSDSGVTNLSHFGDGCSVGSLTNGASATQYEYYTGYDDNGYLNNADVAIAAGVTHLVYFYPDSASAAAAWNGIGSGFAACAKAETGTNPTTGSQVTGHTTSTTSANDAQCWSNVVTGTSKPTGAGTSDHVCFVRQGDQIAAVDVKVNFSKSAYLSTVDYGTFDTTLRQDLVAGLGGELNSGDLPVCASADLKVTLGPSGTYQSNGADYRVLIVTNVGTSTCTVAGYPAAMLVDGSGAIKTTAGNVMQDPNDAKVYPEGTVTLAPNATGSAILSWSSAANLGNCLYSGSYSLEVVAPDSSTATRTGTLSKVCDALSVTPLRLGLLTP